jgi:hypothetical protein
MPSSPTTPAAPYMAAVCRDAAALNVEVADWPWIVVPECPAADVDAAAASSMLCTAMRYVWIWVGKSDHHEGPCPARISLLMED